MKMKKKTIVFSLLFLIFIIVAVILVLFWGRDKKDATVQRELNLADGILSWDAVDGAVSYDVTAGGYTKNIEGTEIDLAAVCKTEGEISVSVSVIDASGEQSRIGSLNITALWIEEPRVAIKRDEEGRKYYLWYKDEHASGYTYALNDGQGFRKIETEGTEFVIPVETEESQRITVRAKGGSEKTILYMDNEYTLKNESDNIFNLAQLSKYPFVYKSDGSINAGKYFVATSLPSGSYELDVTLYLMDSEGAKLTGNGSWGRRIVDGRDEHWFCEDEVENFPESKDTIPNPGTPITQRFLLNVNRFGEVVFDQIYSFLYGEMVVFADIRLDGKSVIADKPIDHSKDEVYTLDIESLQPIAIYTGAGIYYAEGTPDQFEVRIPVSWKDGVYNVKVGYYIAATDGSALEGNGIWARTIAGGHNSNEKVYLCEYPIKGLFDEGLDLQRADKKRYSEFSVKVKNGEFILVCTGMRKTENIIFTDVEQISGSSKQFNVSSLKNNKNVFTSTGPKDYIPELFYVLTTLSGERKEIEAEVTYCVMDSEGYMLMGNGLAARRITDEDGNDFYICNKQVNANTPESAHTIPESTTEITKKMKVVVNKKGRFILQMNEFLEGEMVVIRDVKYEGNSILAN